MIAEITLSHLMRLGNEQGCPVSRQQALAFLNQEGRAFEMWKHMMQAAEDFIAGSLFQHSFTPGGHNEFASRPRPERSISTAARQRHSVFPPPYSPRNEQANGNRQQLRRMVFQSGDSTTRLFQRCV